MRSVLSLLVLLFVLSLPAWAADPSVPDSAPGPAHHGRQTSEQHFAQANLAHDGHLTLEEAKSGYPSLVRNFDDIDVDHKGYVTEGDVRAWRVMRTAARRLAKPLEDRLRPRGAFQSGCPDLRSVSAPGSQTVAPSVDPPAGEK
jgi:hypothetical protein